MTNIQEINSAIMFGNLTNDQLTSIIDAVKYARAQLTQEKKRSVTIGSTVKFTSNRNGRTYQGIVRKIAIKFITVDTGSMVYRVPANMLEVA